MKRRHISSGSEFEEKIGYSRAVVDGDYVFVSGTTGYKYETMSISSDVVEQAEQCFKTIEKVLIEAGSSIDNVCVCTTFIPIATTLSPVGLCLTSI
jgi:Putative translation initiation inhibitor, yjgF family